MLYPYQPSDGVVAVPEDIFVPELLLEQLALIESLGGMEEFERLRAKLSAANLKRRTRTLSIEVVMIAVKKALLHKRGLEVMCGGQVKKRMHMMYGSTTTLALAVRVGESAVICDVGTCEAYRPWPSKVWAQLAPWKVDCQPDPGKLADWVEARTRRLRQGTLWK
jgi:hypothetical protein